MTKSVPYLTVNLPGPIPCLGSPHQRTCTVDIAPDAPPGPKVFQIIGTTSAAECGTLVTVTVLELTLTETPVAYLPENANTVSYTATIEQGGATDFIRFQLFDVSDFPGDAMNHGTQADDDPDFKFEAAENPGFTIASNQLTATTDTPVASATVTVTAYDYGARGKIKAILVNLGCESEDLNIYLTPAAKFCIC